MTLTLSETDVAKLLTYEQLIPAMEKAAVRVLGRSGHPAPRDAIWLVDGPCCRCGRTTKDRRLIYLLLWDRLPISMDDYVSSSVFGSRRRKEK